MSKTGGSLTAPPADAPLLPTQPLQADAGSIVVFDRTTHEATGEVVRPIDRARANEQALAPLTFDRTAPVPNAILAPHTVQAPPPVQAAADSRPPTRSQPAASADEDPVTARPARGLPGTAHSPHRAKPMLGPEGGFGAGPSEYFALTGEEIRTAIEQCMDELHAQIQNDLRFSIAITYPRYAITVQVIVEAENQHALTIQKIAGQDAVPVEIAQQYADSVVFVVKKERREFDAQGEVQQPPDALREELDLPVPQKTIVQTALGPMASDLRL